MQDVSKRLSRNLYMMMGTPREDTKKFGRYLSFQKQAELHHVLLVGLKMTLKEKKNRLLKQLLSLLKH